MKPTGIRDRKYPPDSAPNDADRFVIPARK
jgi:hypothetical protein